MVKVSSLALALGLRSAFVAASTGYPGHGLIGYGIEMYKPPCAFACHDTIAASMLSCSEHAEEEMDMGGGGMMMHMGGDETSPECYATDDAYLQTLAYCISQRCSDLPVWKLEKYWNKFAIGRQPGQPLPKESYQQALAKVTSAPTETLVSGDPLNKTMLVGDDDYQANFNGAAHFEQTETDHQTYALVVFLSGIVVPVAFSLLRFVPWPATLRTQFYSWVIDPPAFGRRHKTSVAGLVHVPTRGQALFIFYLVAINFILCAVDIQSISPNAWFGTTKAEVLGIITNRCGVLSFANIPLLILYAGRNNVLLWLTNWEHNTFLLVHRWVAWIATIQAVIHSCIFLDQYIDSKSLAEEAKLPYWIWGCIATIALSIMVVISVQPIRRKFYEVFLAFHIILAVFTVVGCYLHMADRFHGQWGYENWIWVAVAVWGFDRLMRVLRLARNGVKHAVVTPIDDEYVRVDIPDVHGAGHAYLYFPTLTWRVWENHPFSVASSILHSSSTTAVSRQNVHLDEEKHAHDSDRLSESDSNGKTAANSTIAAMGTKKVGLTFILRAQTGLTSLIRHRTSLPVLVESGYAPHKDLSAHPTLLVIAGGVGITAALPQLRAHPGRAKLFWGVRTQGIVDELADSLALPGLERETFVGRRMDVAAILEREVYAEKGADLAVVVSGPDSMADEVRWEVARLGRLGGNKIRLVEEAYSW